MTRSGYSEYDGDGPTDQWRMICYRGAVKRALTGKRGQAFLRDMAAAMDAMPVKELIASALITPEGACCAMGTVLKSRGIDATRIDPEDPEAVATITGISPTMAREIAFENDDDFSAGYLNETPAQRWTRMRLWIDRQLIKAPTP